METFLKIDWHPPLQDIIDNEFINEERYEREGAMYKILRGTFKDPCEDMENDYNKVDLDLLGDSDDYVEDEEDEEDSNVPKNGNAANKTDKSKSNAWKYIPGLLKQPYKFPRASRLNKEQQAVCLRVLLRFSASQKPELTQADREELDTYISLKDIISQEQDEYLETAKSNWDDTSLSVVCEEFINSYWKHKMSNIRKLPRYYTEQKNIPFVRKQEMHLQFVTECLNAGKLPKIVLPTFTRRYILPANSSNLEARLLERNTSLAYYRLPVSEDPNCENLAIANDVDLVISSSGLVTMLNNIGPNYTNSWILPVVIKAHNDKNVIYIDKPVPPESSSILQKNTWVYKHILRCAMIPEKRRSQRSHRTDVCEEEDIFQDASCENILKIEESCEDNFRSDGSQTHNNREEASTTASEEKRKLEQNKTELPEQNVSYKLFIVGPQVSEQSELMKDILVKDYRILVRTKTDGVEVLSKDEAQLLILAPKLEHQVALGAEAITLEEGLKQWISLTFRPNTALARVRINVHTSEALQIERRTAMSVDNEIKRLYHVKPEDTLKILYNAVQSLSIASPGRYLLRHTVRNGAFATVYKQVDNPGQNVFDLRTVCDNTQYFTIPRTPWPCLDKMVTTPMHRNYERMPAMFHPPNKTGPLKKQQHMKKRPSNAGEVRRSLRIKKAKSKKCDKSEINV